VILLLFVYGKEVPVFIADFLILSHQVLKFVTKQFGLLEFLILLFIFYLLA